MKATITTISLCAVIAMALINYPLFGTAIASFLLPVHSVGAGLLAIHLNDITD